MSILESLGVFDIYTLFEVGAFGVSDFDMAACPVEWISDTTWGRNLATIDDLSPTGMG